MLRIFSLVMIIAGFWIIFNWVLERITRSHWLFCFTAPSDWFTQQFVVLQFQPIRIMSKKNNRDLIIDVFCAWGCLRVLIGLFPLFPNETIQVLVFFKWKALGQRPILSLTHSGPVFHRRKSRPGLRISFQKKNSWIKCRRETLGYVQVKITYWEYLWDIYISLLTENQSLLKCLKYY